MGFPPLETEYQSWSAPKSSLRIEYPAAALEDMCADAVEALSRFRHGGVEIGGVLFGTHRDGTVRIVDYRPLACEYAFGPRFTLSEKDRANLRELIFAPYRDPELRGLRVVGWYHSHTRSDLVLSPRDLELYERFFSEPWQIAVVVRPEPHELSVAGFFVRDGDPRPVFETEFRARRHRERVAAVAPRPAPEPAAPRPVEPVAAPAVPATPEPLPPPPAAPEPAPPRRRLFGRRKPQEPSLGPSRLFIPDPDLVPSEPAAVEAPAPSVVEPVRRRVVEPPSEPEPAPEPIPARVVERVPEPEAIELPEVQPEPEPERPAPRRRLLAWTVKHKTAREVPVVPDPEALALPELTASPVISEPEFAPSVEEIAPAPPRSYLETTVPGVEIPEPAAAPAPLETAPLPSWAQTESPRRRWWVWAFAAVLLVAAAVSAGWYWLAARSAPPLSLWVADVGGQLMIEWDRTARPIRKADRGTIEIADGGERIVIQMDADKMKEGSVDYVRKSEIVDVRMSVMGADGRPVSELVRFIGPPVSQTAYAEITRERDALKAEVDRLTAELEKAKGAQRSPAARRNE